jgi:hypothetical protein
MPIEIRFLSELTDNEAQSRAAWCEDQYQLCDRQRRRIESEWGTNILFLQGNQWESAAEDMRRFGRIHVPTTVPNKVKITSNRILPLYRQACAAVADNIAQLVATPATSDQPDVEAAEIATDALESRLYEDREHEKRRDETGWTMSCGRVLRMSYWDPDLDGYGDVGKMKAVGDLDTVTLNPWRFHLPPWCSSTEEPDFVIVSDIRGIDEIEAIYGKSVEAEEVADAAKWLDKLVMSIVTGSEMGGTPKRNKAALLKRMYCKPTAQYPRGRVWTWANKVLLQVSDLPEGEMPFVALDWFPIPGRQYPLPFISPLRDLQHEINVALSQLIDLKNRQLRGDVIIRGSGQVTQEYAMEPTTWDPVTGLPTAWRRTAQKVVRLGSGVEEFSQMRYDLNTTEAELLISRLWSDMQDAAGVRDPSIGKQLRSGTTLGEVSILKDADNQGLGFFRYGFDLAHAKIGRLKLVIQKNHYDIPRMVRIVGERNAVRTKSFMGSDLRNTEDVRPRPVPIISESEKMMMVQQLGMNAAFDLTGSPQAKLNKVKVLLNSGIPGIREDVESMLGDTSVEDLEAVCAEINKIEIQASLLAAQAMLNQATLANQGQEAQAQAMIDGQGQGMGTETMMAAG